MEIYPNSLVPCHAQVCDFVAIARLLNATIVLPNIQAIVSVKGGR
jgi:hypothetical protein